MCQKRPVFIFNSETLLAWLSNGLSSWPIDSTDLFAGGDNKDNYHLVRPKASDIFLCLLNNICNFYFYLNVYIFCQRIAVLLLMFSLCFNSWLLTGLMIFLSTDMDHIPYLLLFHKNLHLFYSLQADIKQLNIWSLTNLGHNLLCYTLFNLLHDKLKFKALKKCMSNLTRKCILNASALP